MPPVPIENRVKEKIPIVSNAMLVGDKAKFLSVLLTLKVTWVSCGVSTPDSRGYTLWVLDLLLGPEGWLGSVWGCWVW